LIEVAWLEFIRSVFFRSRAFHRMALAFAFLWNRASPMDVVEVFVGDSIQYDFDRRERLQQYQLFSFADKAR
jgi:hypothetical protein